MEDVDIEDNVRSDIVGNCAAYLNSGSVVAEAIVEYKIKYPQIGNSNRNATHELMSDLNQSVVILISRKARKNKVLKILKDTRKIIIENGLCLGEFGVENDDGPFYLFDLGKGNSKSY